MQRFLTAGLAVGLVVALVRGQDGPVTIKIRQQEVGDAVKQTETSSFSLKTTITGLGKPQERSEATTHKFVARQEVLDKAADAKSPTKWKWTLLAVEQTPEDKVKDAGLIGKPLVIEKKGDKLVGTFADGKPLSEEQERFFDAHQRMDADEKSFHAQVFPKKPVTVGEAWTADVAELGKSFDTAEIDLKKSSATGKLTKVYKKDGLTFGVLEFKVQLVLTKLRTVPKGQLKDGSMVLIDATYDLCIDGTSTAGTIASTVKVEMDAIDEVGVGNKTTMIMKNTLTTEPVKK